MRRKYKVKVKIIKLGFIRDDDDDDVQKAVAIEVKWEGESGSGFAPFNLGRKRMRKDLTREAFLTRKRTAIDTVEWNDEEFENVCNFGSDSWQVCFNVLYRRKKKMAVIGRSTLDLSEILGRKKNDELGELEEKVVMNLKFGGMYTQANLLVRFDFEEIIDGPKPVEPGSRPDRPSQSGYKAKSRSSETQFEPAKKLLSLFSWKKRRLSFKPTRAMAERECTDTGSSFLVEPAISGPPIPVQPQDEDEENRGEWESRELTSRDGKTTLKTNVFFASFDQCSNKAAGESACTALVAVISHWLHTNTNSMPTRPEFNLLIQEGSSEWRKLCENDTFSQNFPNKHFDLETILHSDVKPLAISRGDSFVGFFSPEKFESLKGAMSFEEIWDGIKKASEDHDHDHEPRIYIVSWNDHFFVLKVEENACYIIDTLGERLFEGCNQAFILRFDESSLMYGEEMEIISKGKYCCKEFIKRFLAAIPITELEEEEEKKGVVSYYSLHHQLQIEFNSTYLLPSSTKSSPFSSSSNSSASSSSSIDDK